MQTEEPKMQILKVKEADVRFYASVTGCPLRCEGINNAPAEGYSPRGFFALAERSTIVFLIVAADPGPWLPGDPRGGTPESRAREFLEDPRFFSPEKKRTDFHRGILVVLSEILGVGEDDLFHQVVYANLVKCSSLPPVGQKKKTIPMRTQSTCYATHLAREIEYFRPLAIIAAGSRDFFERHPPTVPWFPLSLPGSRRYGIERYEKTRELQIAKIKRWYETEVRKGGGN
jgi:hypothetical protein